MKTKSELWLEYANAHRDDFAGYSGACQCWWCNEYRSAANRWITKQLAAQSPAPPTADGGPAAQSAPPAG